MKKIFFTLAAGFISAAAIVSSASAQRAADSTQNGKHTRIYAKNETKAYGIKNAGALNEVITDATGADSLNNNTAGATTINKKAIKNFTAAFGNAEAVKWLTLTDGFVAYWTLNGTRNRSVYNKRGNWLYSIQNYDEKNLPVDIRAIVKRTYYDFSIYGVQEIHVENKIAYLIYMKDETTFLTVRVCDDEMDVMNKFTRDLH
jgi:hypothetical protein